MKKLAIVLIMFAMHAITPFPVLADTIGSARISQIEGDVLVQTNETGIEWVAASINVPLLSGDKIWVPDNGSSEMQFLGGSYIRAGKNTGLDITKLNRDSQGNTTQIALTQGRTYIYYNGSSDNKSLFQVDTPLVSAMAYSSAIFDLFVYEDGYAEVSVIKGTVYVEGQHGNTKVDMGYMLSVSAGKHAELLPRRLNDGWLSWNLSRDSLIAQKGTSVRYLPPTLDDYGADFDKYGHWVHTPAYGYVWSPRITVNAWAPYRDGRWVWRNGDYVWVSYEPWGWVPYHYGRWGFTVGIGWFWVPPALNDVFWGPGFVAWINTPTYVSWVPLGPGEIYYGHGHYGHHSVNVTKVNIKNINVTNVYLNSRVAHAVTVLHHDTFAKGKHVKGANAPANPFLAGLRVSAGRPSVKQVNYSPLPLKTVQQRHLPSKTTTDNKRTIELNSREIALNKNNSLSKGSKPISPMRVTVIRDQKSVSSKQRLERWESRTAPQASNRVQRQVASNTPSSNSAIRRAEPRTTPKAGNYIQRQESRSTFAQNKNQVQRLETKPASTLRKEEKYGQRKEK